MRFLLIAAVVAAFAPASVSAQVSYLECTKTGGRSTWVPDQFVIARDGAARDVTVSDSIGIPRGLPPSSGRVQRENNSRLTVAWKLKGLRDSRGTRTAAMQYKAVLNKQSGEAKISASPLGFSEVFSGKAKCAPMAPAKVARITKLLKSPKVNSALKKSASQRVKYECTLSDQSLDSPFVSKKFLFDIERSGRKAVVEDAFSTKHVGGKVAAKVVKRTNRNTVVAWTLENMNGTGSSTASTLVHTNVPFKASLQNGGGGFSLSVTRNPRKPPKQFRGACKLVK